MSRRSTQPDPALRCTPLLPLLRWVLSAAEARRVEMVGRAEQLHDSLEPAATYPLDYLAYRLTGFRREWGDDAVMLGEAVAPDLRQFIDGLSKSVEMPAGDNAAPADVWAMKLEVSTKTLQRWRGLGLRWRWVVPAGGGRKVVGYTADAVERFRRQHGQRVEEASRFSQLDAATRRELIDAARALRDLDDTLSLNQVARQLAEQTGRALETIRQVLRKHDRAHPDEAVFPGGKALTRRQLGQAVRWQRNDQPITAIAKRFGVTPAKLRRALLERRAEVAARLRLSHEDMPLFEREDAASVFLTEGPEAQPDALPRSGVPTADLPEPVAAIYRQGVLDDASTRRVFMRMHFLKFRASRRRGAWTDRRPRAAELDAFEGDVRAAGAARRLLVRLNLPTVLSVARRHLIGQDDPHAHRLVGLLAVGHATLAQTVDAYHPGQRPTFESFLTNRLLQRFAQVGTVIETPGAKPKAVRRLSPQQAAKKLLDAANESGVFVLEDPV